MSTSNKILIGLLFAALAAWLGFYIAQLQRIRQLTEEIARLELSLSECGRREEGAAREIEKQNRAVEAVRVDTIMVEKQIKDVVYRYVTVREYVTESLGKDSGCENKVDNIDYALRRFHGVGVRPAEGGNKD